MIPLKIKGKKFNKLTPLKIIRTNHFGNFWLCKCDCGNEVEVLATNIKTGKTKSCGCLVTERNLERCLKHGLSQARIYNTFSHMKQRCLNKNNFSYKDYGGRGIKCLWKSFEDFHKDMYKSYVQHIEEFGKKQTTIDRTDNNGNYCKENCRWATLRTQNNNTRNNLLVTFNGKTKTISEWAILTGIKKKTLRNRIVNLGWSIDKALNSSLYNR